MCNRRPRISSSNCARDVWLFTSTNGALEPPAFAATTSLRDFFGQTRFSPPASRFSVQAQYVRLCGLIPSSAANSAVVRPLSRQRSTRFAHSSRDTRVRFCNGSSMSANLRQNTALGHDAVVRTHTIFRRETLACRCGQHVVTASVPDKVFDKTQYGPGFLAHLVVSKCCDSLPLYRMEQQFGRLGIPMSRSTMTDLFHRAGELVAPLAHRIIALIAASEIVLADETPMPVQDDRKKPYIWTFVSGTLVAYRFSMSRSGDTPKAILGGTTGTLVVDMYTGYNAITGVEGRQRAGCLSHARRKFFKALHSAPEAQVALDLIRDIYVIERDVKMARETGEVDHARARWEQCLPIMDKLYVWLAKQKEQHPPKSVMGNAISYTLKNWQALTRFITDTAIPPDNNRSERALRVVALGRKNFLFAGNKDAGENLAALYTVVATCVANEVDPLAYLTDVLTRLDSTTAEEVDTLLPQNWAVLAP